MTSEGFSVAEVACALGQPVATVEVLATFASATATVARLRVRFADGSQRVAIGKRATGAEAAAARRERRFFERLAPCWDHPAPKLLGVSDDAVSVLLLTEDLEAQGYRAVGTAVSEPEFHGAIDALVGLHARFWDALPLEVLEAGGSPEPSVTQAVQAWPPTVIAANAIAVREASERFAVGLEAGERALLADVLAAWAPRFVERTAAGRGMTLIHADFHCFGNVLFVPGAPRPRVIDWSEIKPGLGPHDLAYCLMGLPCVDRARRDDALMRRYWEGLCAAGIRDYSWPLCQWDHRFSVLTNLFQAVFQGSEVWFRKTAAAVDALDACAALAEPPPL
ncbi:phosphotransferase family protein [Corallococcus exercitus]|uniref:phosphotransferase family protein n=1 Tax=Corallococcus exercitus TaxID=2316736 RepID=UPI001ABF943D|nr:phosphotransferase [Corallococcus exercitus]